MFIGVLIDNDVTRRAYLFTSEYKTKNATIRNAARCISAATCNAIPAYSAGVHVQLFPDMETASEYAQGPALDDLCRGLDNPSALDVFRFVDLDTVYTIAPDSDPVRDQIRETAALTGNTRDHVRAFFDIGANVAGATDPDSFIDTMRDSAALLERLARVNRRK